MEDSPDAMSPSRAWDVLARGWSEQQGKAGDPNQRWIINPALFGVIGDIDGKSVLDAGCGGGHISRELTRRGAKATGIDISPSMIEIAAAHARKEGLSIRFLVNDISSMPEIPSATFDMVVSSMALMNVDHLAQAFAEFARVLHRHGRLIFSIPHPCFPRIKGGRGVFKRDARGEERLDYYRVMDYQSEGSYGVPIPLPESSPGEIRVPTFHRTLSTYISLLADAGFLVDALAEPKPANTSEAEKELGPGWWDATSRIAYYIVIGTRRMDGAKEQAG